MFNMNGSTAFRDESLNYSWEENYAKIRLKFLENWTLDENATLEENYDYIFDNVGVRTLFIILYSIVFCGCVFGNLTVILLVFLTRRLKSTTNFFLANLAFADLCVGIFCVFQNLAFYLITSWVFGDFLCKMNQFIYGLSCTASIFILVVISVERYLAIIHPIRCKRILTKNRLKMIISLVWIVSTAYAMPRYLISHTILNPLSESFEIICIMSRIRYNSKVFDVINFILLYLIPLAVMTILYSIIAVRLWNSNLNYSSSRKLSRAKSMFERGSLEKMKISSAGFEKKNTNFSERRRGRGSTNESKQRFYNVCHEPEINFPTSSSPCFRSGKNILRARRKVIRMLTILVLAFAICNLPFHARKMWQYWSSQYDGTSSFSSLFTPITFLCTYCNSLVNPLLYAFLSKNFQKSIMEFFACSWRRKNHSKRISFRRKCKRSVTRSMSNNE